MNVKTEAAGKARYWASQLTQLAAVVAIVLVGKGALAEPFYVPSGSMEPTLLIGDALLASKYPYGYSTASLPIHVAFPDSGRVFGATPDRGDVVVFRWPGNRAQGWVKRGIGLPGDRVRIDGGVISINGVAAKVTPDGTGRAEDEDGAYRTAARFVETLPGGFSHPIFKLYDNVRLDTMAEITVPAGHLFVMGDNRDNSADSRVPLREGGVGLLSVDNLVGRVDAIVGSWNPGVRRQPITDWLSGFRVARFFTSVH
jgi:signal peptidase I